MHPSRRRAIDNLDDDAGERSIVGLLAVHGVQQHALRPAGRRSGGRLVSAWRQQFFNAAVRVAGKPLQHVVQVGPRIVSVELDRLHEAQDDRRVQASQVAVAGQPCAAPHPSAPEGCSWGLRPTIIAAAFLLLRREGPP